MNKKNLLKVINILLAIAFFMTAMGGLIRFFFSSVIPYELFRAIHPKFGIALVILLSTHLYLNWGWVKNTYFSKNKAQ